MTCTARRRRTGPTSRRPLWEGLESRIVLSSMIFTDPAPDASLLRSPDALHIGFHQTIADYSVGTTDVILDRINADGSLTPVFDDSNAPYEGLDNDGTGLTFTLNATLSPGRYRLLLSGSSMLSGEDGTPLSPLDGIDAKLGDFTIMRPGVGLADAIDLGRLGPVPSSVSGTLDFATNPSDLKLYKITLPAGQFTRLGLEVAAARDGSPLNSALTLFDSQGHALATSEVGRPDAPADPFLFAGLNPGTYYVAVSGAGDLPGLPGGYDLTTSRAGVAQAGAGGEFTLHLVADDADIPGALIDFRITHADPLDPTPTGLTLRFNSPLNLGDSGLNVFDRATGGLTLTDQNGRSWPLAVVNYDETHAALAYLFRDRLPQGIYTVRLATANPLADLSGHPLISPTMPKGVLATFAVAPDTRDRLADGSLAANVPGARSENLGPLTPNLALDGITRTFTIQPGETVALRFVSLYRDFYKLALHHDGGPLAILVNGGKTSYRIDPGPAGQDNAVIDDLRTGEYVTRFTATGAAPVVLTVKLSINAFTWDSLLSNGLGQGPALNLRLVSTDASFSFAFGDSFSEASQLLSSIAIAPTGPAFGPSPQSSSATTGATASPGFGAPNHPVSEAPGNLAPGSSSLVLDIGGVLVGRPNPDADHVASVGPAGVYGSVALAEVGNRFGQANASAANLRGAFITRLADGPSQAVPADPGPMTDGSLDPGAPAPAAPRDAAVTPSSVEDLAAPLAVSEVASPGESLAAPSPEVAAIPVPLASSPSPASAASDETGGVSPWLFGIAGALALGGRLIHHRLTTRRTPALAATRHIPAPHYAPTKVRV
ncbi:MAG: hypothetical protein JWN86_3825 [Planctomycetota bacterium]|nr:hypothetical protein [Planctomycetota bacterium]